MRFLWSSDQHTLHHTTPTGHVLGNLTKFLCRDNDLSKTDMIFFGGDFFDRVVESPNTDMFKVQDWGREFLDKAHTANPDMTVVWLEGTSSHDRRQPRHFLNLAPKGFDVRYIDTITVEIYERHQNLSVLYVPDNQGSLTPDEIWELALKALKEKELEQVDLICFHGGFDFQMHPKARHKAHQLERWESIVKYGIFAGHIHIPVRKGKLFTSGSFDRDKHGEEHPKGGYIINLDKEEDIFNPVFYENKRALPYVTLEVNSEITPEDLIKDIHAFIERKKLVPFSQIRIKGGKGHVVNPVMGVLAREYPLFGFKADNELSNDVVVDDNTFDSTLYQGVSLTPENLKASLFPEVESIFAELGIDKAEAFDVLEDFL